VICEHLDRLPSCLCASSAEPTRIAGGGAPARACHGDLGVYFERRKYRGKYVGPILDGHTGQSACELISVTVAAAECMIADALTKLVFTLRGKAAGLLAQYRADALLPLSAMVRHLDVHSPATPATRLDSIEALAEIFSLRRGSAAFCSAASRGLLELSAVSPGDFETSAKSWAMKIHGAAAMAILVLIGMLLNAM